MNIKLTIPERLKDLRTERGLTLEEALRLSTAAGAASVMCTGTQAASLETIQQLMEQVTYREL